MAAPWHHFTVPFCGAIKKLIVNPAFDDFWANHQRLMPLKLKVPGKNFHRFFSYSGVNYRQQMYLKAIYMRNDWTAQC